MKSKGFCQNPQEIMEEYNGCSVSRCRAYPRICRNNLIIPTTQGDSQTWKSGKCCLVYAKAFSGVCPCASTLL